MTLIVDAGPLVASADDKDPLAEIVQRVIRQERRPIIVPASVSAEVDYLLATRLGRHSRVAFLEDIADGRFTVECLSQDEHAQVVRLERMYSDLDPGLADLSLVVLAARFRTRRLLTFDERHFRAIRPLQGGSFTILPKDV